jgi:hypothetical protein
VLLFSFPSSTIFGLRYADSTIGTRQHPILHGFREDKKEPQLKEVNDGNLSLSLPNTIDAGATSMAGDDGAYEQYFSRFCQN